MKRRIQTILLSGMITVMIGAVIVAPVMAMTVSSSEHFCRASADACPMTEAPQAEDSCCAAHKGADKPMTCHAPATPGTPHSSDDSNCPDHCPCCVVGPMMVAWAPAAVDAVHFIQALTHDDVNVTITVTASDWVHDLFHPPCL